MPRISKIVLAKTKIEQVLDLTNKRIFSQSDLNNIFDEFKEKWDLGYTCTEYKFIKFLIENSYLKELQVFGNKILYQWREDTDDIIYEIALAIRPRSYISHYTASFMHNLTEQIPKSIYVTYERAYALSNTGDSQLKQESIDIAFQKEERVTKEVYEYGDYRITMISSPRSDKIGVVKYQLASGIEINITNLERTLIDIVVRPIYSGGINEVMKAYKAAAETLQVNKLKAYITKLQFIYPYQQAIGFYLEKAGIADKRLKILEKICDNKYNFYLDRKIKNANYSKRWKIYYPDYLKNNLDNI